MASLFVEVLSPEGVIWRGNANALIARSSEGDFTILPQHTATVGDVVACVLRVETSDARVALAVHTGYFQVGPGDEPGETRATVLVGVAELVAQIDVERALRAKENASARLSSLGESIDEDERLEVLAALARAELRLSAAAQFA